MAEIKEADVRVDVMGWQMLNVLNGLTTLRNVDFDEIQPATTFAADWE